MHVKSANFLRYKTIIIIDNSIIIESQKWHLTNKMDTALIDDAPVLTHSHSLTHTCGIVNGKRGVITFK